MKYRINAAEKDLREQRTKNHKLRFEINRFLSMEELEKKSLGFGMSRSEKTKTIKVR